MKKTWIELATTSLLRAGISEAATTFTGVIVDIDQTQRTITFQTIDGETWVFTVADSNIVKQEQVAKGDRVRIEVDVSEKITKITKISERPLSESTQTLDEVRP
ncbi:MAG: hypothetical protein ACREJN_11220 [Nitrospiraceae bacterium]